jgi:hypothetical protein
MELVPKEAKCTGSGRSVNVRKLGILSLDHECIAINHHKWDRMLNLRQRDLVRRSAPVSSSVSFCDLFQISVL